MSPITVHDAPSPAEAGEGAVRSEWNDLATLFLLRFDRENTRLSYRTALKAFFGTNTVSLDMALQMSLVDVNRHISSMERRGRAPATIRGRVSAIRSFYAWLVALGIVQLNPAARELVRRTPLADWRKKSVPVLTRDESIALLDAPDPDSPSGIRDRALLRVLLKGFLRRGEAVGLDFQHVRETGGYWVLDIPRAKGGANQYIKATDDVVASIARVRELYQRSGFRDWETGAVFRTLRRGLHYGGRMSGQGVAVVVKKAARQAGLPLISPHVLRHTGCTLALEGGASLIQVKNHARHVLAATTMIYVHQRDRLENSAADYISF